MQVVVGILKANILRVVLADIRVLYRLPRHMERVMIVARRRSNHYLILFVSGKRIKVPLKRCSDKIVEPAMKL
jgi:hypothetical protein